MFGRAWHALYTVRSQALQADQSRECQGLSTLDTIGAEAAAG